MAAIVIVGGSFAGLTAAFELRKKLGAQHEVMVISNNPNFVFIPSMPWVVLGSRSPDQVSFALEPALRGRGIRFQEDSVTQVDLEHHVVHTRKSVYSYDYLIMATGPALDFSAVPGLGPHNGYTQSVCNLPDALHAKAAWQEFMKKPGPIVIGAAQGASCFGAGYEFLLNVDTYLRRQGIRDRVPLTWVTSEPYVGHFGLGGVGDSRRLVERVFASRNIAAYSNHAIAEATQDGMRLDDGTWLPYAFSMIMPPFRGIDAVLNSPGLGNERGFIPITNQYRHPQHPNVFSAGVTVALAPPQKTPIPTGVPKTGYMSEHMAKIAAANIVADITGSASVELDPGKMKALCLLDAGDSGIYVVAEPLFPPQTNSTLKPGRWVHLAKIAFEKYFMWKMQNGMTQLP